MGERSKRMLFYLGTAALSCYARAIFTPTAVTRGRRNVLR
jgi:hypothetical protein